MKLFRYLMVTWVILLGQPSVFANENQPSPFPISIKCSSPNEVDGALSVFIHPTKSRAVLTYKNAVMDTVISLSINKVSGIYSSSEVTVKSRQTDPLFHRSELTISAYSDEVFRVTRSSAFNITFLIDGETGKVSPDTLTYHDGVVEFDGTSPQTVNLSHLRLECEIEGV